MEQKTITTSATATDQGQFTALAAAWSVDRERDQIKQGAFQGTIQQWRRSGKQIPLHWDHRGDPASIIGHIDPQSMRETDQGLLVKGQLDLENSEMAREAWRLIKGGTVGLSFGYLATGQQKRADGVRELSELDVFEISVTPAPMNADTRILTTKSIEELGAEIKQQMMGDEPQGDQPPTPVQQRILNSMVGQAQEFIASDPDPEDAAEMADIIEALEELRGESATADSAAGQGKRLLLVNRDEYRLLQETGFKAVWTAAYVNSLPDSCFLYVEDGGTKDSEGKTTPRSLRHFPVRDASGAVDMPHLRNAMSRVPQSNLPQAVKDRVAAMAQRMMDSQKAIGGQEPSRARAVDPARRHSEQVALEIQSGGASLRKSPPVAEEKSEVQARPEDELRRQTRDLYLEILTETS